MRVSPILVVIMPAGLIDDVNAKISILYLSFLMLLQPTRTNYDPIITLDNYIIDTFTNGDHVYGSWIDTGVISNDNVCCSF